MVLIGKANKINLVFLPTDSSNSLFLGGIIYDVLIEELVVFFTLFFKLSSTWTSGEISTESRRVWRKMSIYFCSSITERVRNFIHTTTFFATTTHIIRYSKTPDKIVLNLHNSCKNVYFVPCRWRYGQTTNQRYNSGVFYEYSVLENIETGIR